MLLLVASLGYILTSGSALLQAQLGVLAWKLVLVTTAIIAAHYFRRQVFPYLDLSEIVKSDDTRSGLFFLGTMLFYAAIIFALCGGL